MPQDILKPDEHRKFQPARFGLFDDVGQVNGSAGFPLRFGNHVAGFVDVEVSGPPSLNVVQVSSLLDIPVLAGLARIAHLENDKSNRTIEGWGRNSIAGNENSLGGSL